VKGTVQYDCAADAIRHPGIAAGKMSYKENVALPRIGS